MIGKLYNQICALYSIAPYTLDANGQKKPLSQSAQKEFLSALGSNISAEGDSAHLFADLIKQRLQRPVPSCLVVSEETHDFLSLPVRLPQASLSQPLYWQITEENGNKHSGEYDLTNVQVSDVQEIGTEQFVAFNVTLSVSLPCGYHTLTLTSDILDRGFKAACTLIITPKSCYVPPGLQKNNRIWGMSCQLGTIRSTRNWGIGDFADLRNLMAWSSQHGAGAVAINPIQSSFLPNDNCSLPPPHNSYTFLNPIYIAPEEIDDFHECEDAVRYFQDPAVKIHLSSLRDEELVDFQEVALVKTTIFEICWASFRENHLDPDSDRGREFRFFQRTGGEELRSFAIFESLRQQFLEQGKSPNWPDWPQEYRLPATAALDEFANENLERIEFQEYLQWQATLQTAALGRRSMELGLKVGLLLSLPDNVSRSSFETWYQSELYLPGLRKANDVYTDLPPLFRPKLAEVAYKPFIAMLRSSMRYAGALAIPLQLFEDNSCWALKGDAGGVFCLDQPATELLGIIALESSRNHCQVICLHDRELTGEFRTNLGTLSILTYRPGHFETEDHGEWLATSQYQPQCVVAASDERLTSINGFWLGKDIDIQECISSATVGSQREERIITRAAERAKLLVALYRQKLLPDDYDVDPSTVSWLRPDLVQSIHLFLARTMSKVFLLPMNDLPCLQETDVTSNKFLNISGWQRKLGMDLEIIKKDEQLHALFRSFCAERGIGIVKPSALLIDRRTSMSPTMPRAFYRLQLNQNFTFRNAAELVPYLHGLGISHCYTSPCLKARPNSPHCYDIIDHSVLNPELGSREEFEGFVAALDKYQMAQIIDMVPNHMAAGSDNRWWMDVLENGQSSQYSDFFDINWQPHESELRGRVLLPILGDYYGSVLEGGQLQLDFAREQGAFYIHYSEHRFPVDPQTYPLILSHDLERLERQLSPQHHGFLELQNLFSSFANLPDRQELEPEQRRVRQRDKEVLKRLLARLCSERHEISFFIEENVVLYNGEKFRPESFDPLHNLLAGQAYRLAFWRVASDEINYRRFFDINELAGIRMENPRVFEETHRLVLDLIATGKVDGLRIDHPDGLYDPKRYFHKLQETVSDETSASNKPLYVVIEKILSGFEHLPSDWLVHGTTGYDFGAMVNGIFIDQAAENKFTKIYEAFIEHTIEFDNLLYHCKKLIIKTSMASELNVLANKLHRLAKMSRHTQDFTLNRLREALVEFVAYFPVYRTYISTDGITRNDRNFIEWAIAKAEAGQRAEDISIYGFLQNILLQEIDQGKPSELQNAARDFVMKVQQYTGPVMAKGFEDTAFYIANRLLSLNEVGGDPRRFGNSLSAFHQSNRERANHHPYGMLTISTHDSKRSGDVRARINVLSELHEEWQMVLKHLQLCNEEKRTRIGKHYAPSRNDEYALYQNLIGIWPFEEMNAEQKAFFTSRVEEYMLKVIREAKVHTSWINQNQAYEEAMVSFVRGILTENNIFLQEFLPFQKKVAWFGIFNSLSQLLLKLTSPGIPDIYQGNEIWHFCLVDPDNRRPVDYEKRRAALDSLQNLLDVPATELTERVGELFEDMTDSRIKLFTLRQTLHCRREHNDLFEHGSYLSLRAEGQKEKHVCAFMRGFGDQRIIVVVPRLLAGLLEHDENCFPFGSEVWTDTMILLPESQPQQTYLNIFTGEEILADRLENNKIEAAVCFNKFPVCLLLQSFISGEDHE